MADNTKIEWTDTTWNPVTGCTKVSPGCAHCYAETVDHRFDHDKVGKLPWAIPASQGGRGVTLHPERLDKPLRWRKGRRIFVNSMSDLFHEDVPDEFIDRVFAAMALTPQHTYQVLTKRPERMLEYMTTLDVLRPSKIQMAAAQASQWREGLLGYPMTEIDWPGWPLPNVWLGVSVENQYWADIRMPPLLQTPGLHFVSQEPALKPVKYKPEWLGCRLCNEGRCTGKAKGGLSWVIVGGESGQRARACEGGIFNAMRSVKAQCEAAGVAVFLKQAGKEGGGPGDPKGAAMSRWPLDLQGDVRQYPAIAEAVTV